MRFLVTGTAGFIGFHVAARLLRDGHEVAGVDGMTPYYDVTLKRRRHAELSKIANSFRAHEFMLEDDGAVSRLVAAFAPDIVIHLAAQAGVRYSIENPRAYIDANVIGSFNILEACRARAPNHLLIASTSSVYGANEDFPFRETDKADRQLTLYAASKKAVEAMAHSYAHLWAIPTTMFRFFTVYGPWGRPDMALFKFTRAILSDEPIDIYNRGDMVRDFTYIDDLVEGIVRLTGAVPAIGRPAGAMDSLSNVAPYRIVNIGGGSPVTLMSFIAEIEAALDKKAIPNLMPFQPGDIRKTEASAALLNALIGYVPSTPVSSGVREFVRWFRDYYKM